MNTLTQTSPHGSHTTGLPTAVSQRPNALVVVDAQRGFIAGAPNGKAVMKYIHWLLDSPQFDVVIATRFINPEHSAFRRGLDYHGMNQGNPETNLDERVEQRADRVIAKYGYGIDTFDLDYVDALLRGNNIDSAVVVGFDTDACVLATAYTLFDAGIVPVIDSRGCGSGGGTEVHEAALKIAARNLCVM